MRADGMFIAVDVDDAAAADTDLARRLTEACPVDIYAQADDGTLELVERNLDECVLCRFVPRRVARRRRPSDQALRPRRRPGLTDRVRGPAAREHCTRARVRRNAPGARISLQTRQVPREQEHAGGRQPNARGPQRRTQSRAPGAVRSPLSPGQLPASILNSSRSASDSARAEIQPDVVDHARIAGIVCHQAYRDTRLSGVQIRALAPARLRAGAS